MSASIEKRVPTLEPEFGAPVVEPRGVYTRGAAIGEFTVRPGVRVRNHAHEGEILFLVLAGALADHGRIGAKGGEVVHAGSLRAIPAGDRRDLEFGPDGATCLVVELTTALPRDSGVQIRRRQLSQDRRLTRLASRLRRYMDPASPGNLPRLELELLELLAQFARHERRARQPEPPAWLRHIRQEIEDAVTYPDLDRLGEQVGVHPLHVVRAFRDHYGCAVGDMLRRIRAERAYRRIVETTESLSGIAASCGFADQSHMTREIRREFGAPPAKLRSEHRQR